MPEAELGGTHTFWREWGEGSRKALAIHCSLAHSCAWEGLAARLGGRLRIAAFDLPGHGQSGPWDPRRDIMDQTVAMAEGLMGGGLLDLIGHSFGAVACLRLAVEHPERVRTLVLYEPVLFAAAEKEGYDAKAHFAPFAEALEAGDPAEAARRFTELWGTGQDWAAMSDRQRTALVERIALIPAANAALFDDRAGVLSPGRLEGVSAPVLLLRGSATPPVIPAITAGLLRRLPDARSEVIAGAGHMGPITHAGEVSDAIVRHLGL